MNYPFIVFEGIDNSGKTTLSKALAAKYTDFKWTKEPVFTTEQADRLNSPEYKDEAMREVLFLEGRLKQQSLYCNNPCFLDRYLWTGMAYAKAFSPSIFNFCVALYQDYHIFRKPSLTIFMETPIETCQAREPALTIDRLKTIRQAYADTEKYVNTPIAYIDGSRTQEECFEAAETVLRAHFPKYFVEG